VVRIDPARYRVERLVFSFMGIPPLLRIL
jgi:hypothetical protein